ncbi:MULTISPECIES: NUDIX hydrolase [Fusobacterium]|uniref:NUDIX hydrolase n=1 Tax=Fusobacterium TaxID=848 RepID=UPI0025C4D842|nr:NUDIX hydrolase [Fusobacterium sp.]MDD7392697.1 NUDIX hydrolase [Fusobacteriaceae bacterium]MDY5306265.1 NUDIX hydrolase [Fusobacterium gastrosuis]MCI5725891.1 NUDIX hydrolase [Fusobacterium sp.]MCI7223450.1 NUDIX hydrolase [Fusobacterium sp.]MDY5794226.1 NUDIX hydrolase [Fusobacterium gastrosuis]
MKFKRISRKEVFKNDVISVYEEELYLPNNQTVTWTFTGKREAVAIIANIGDKIIFVKQYRPAIEKDMIEIPAGIVEVGEDIEEAALREFEEETGYRAQKIEKICSYYGSAGINAGQYHLFYASNLIKTKQNLDENEFLEVLEIPFEEINIFEMEDAKTIIALNFFKEKIYVNNKKMSL